MFPEGPGLDELVDAVYGEVARHVTTQPRCGWDTHCMGTHHLWQGKTDMLPNEYIQRSTLRLKHRAMEL